MSRIFICEVEASGANVITVLFHEIFKTLGIAGCCYESIA